MTRALTAATAAVTSLLDGGFLQLYTGETLLVQMRFSDPAFGPIEDGIAVANELMVGTGRADGVATQWVALTNDSVPVLAGLVGDDMLLSQRYIATGAEVRIERFTYSQSSPV